nr:hypothetical protein [uncultured bacterium]
MPTLSIAFISSLLDSPLSWLLRISGTLLLFTSSNVLFCMAVITMARIMGMMNMKMTPSLSRDKMRMSFFMVAQSLYIICECFLSFLFCFAKKETKKATRNRYTARFREGALFSSYAK